MTLFLISYDLMKPGKNYDALTEALRQKGAKRVLLSQWALKSTSTSVQVLEWARQYMDTNDRILVCEVNANWASWSVLINLNTI